MRSRSFLPFFLSFVWEVLQTNRTIFPFLVLLTGAVFLSWVLGFRGRTWTSCAALRCGWSPTEEGAEKDRKRKKGRDRAEDKQIERGREFLCVKGVRQICWGKQTVRKLLRRRDGGSALAGICTLLGRRGGLDVWFTYKDMACTKGDATSRLSKEERKERAKL